jgi:cation:H+ antiporter
VHATTGTKTGEGEGRHVLVIAQLVGALVLVVIASDAFTNAVEWIGAKFGLTRSAVGAVVAAIGSSLPESIVAIIALVVLRDARSQAIGIGAVIGAPLMLSTVVFSLIGVISLVRREPPGIPQLSIPVAPTIFGAALFFGTFALALAASFTRSTTLHVVAAICVLAAYVVHLAYHLRAGQPEGEEAPPPLRIAPRHKRPSNALIMLQLCVALVVTALASRWFISSLSAASFTFGISALAMSLLLTPVATELPEASSVFLWMRRCEDNLAISNVLGAMMFQTSVACAIAMLATPWQLGPSAYAAGATALISVALLILTTLVRRQVEQWALAASGLFYIGYLLYMART